MLVHRYVTVVHTNIVIPHARELVPYLSLDPFLPVSSLSLTSMSSRVMSIAALQADGGLHTGHRRYPHLSLSILVQSKNDTSITFSHSTAGSLSQVVPGRSASAGVTFFPLPFAPTSRPTSHIQYTYEQSSNNPVQSSPGGIFSPDRNSVRVSPLPAYSYNDR